MSELVRGRDEDEREMYLVGVKGEDGQRRFQLRVWTGQGRDQRTQLVESVISMRGVYSCHCLRVYDAPPVLWNTSRNRTNTRKEL